MLPVAAGRRLPGVVVMVCDRGVVVIVCNVCDVAMVCNRGGHVGPKGGRAVFLQAGLSVDLAIAGNSGPGAVNGQLTGRRQPLLKNVVFPARVLFFNGLGLPQTFKGLVRMILH